MNSNIGNCMLLNVTGTQSLNIYNMTINNVIVNSDMMIVNQVQLVNVTNVTIVNTNSTNNTIYNYFLHVQNAINNGS